MAFGAKDVVARAKVLVEAEVDRASFDRAGNKIGGGLKKGALVGVAALSGLAVAGVDAALAAEDAASVNAKLSKVLENMGKANAAKPLDDLSNALMRSTGVNDEVIKGSQTILATFSEVAASAGQVGGSFARATELSLDLAASGFGSADGAAKMLGKALQDPVKGITALGRAGVTFTEEQKKLIKSLVEQGDALKAQDIILKEVEKQVGGTAEAGAKESEKIKTAAGEVKESLGGLLLSLGDGKEKSDSFSDSLFTLSEQIDALAKSDSWQAVGSVFQFFGERAKQSNKETRDNAQSFENFVERVKATWPGWHNILHAFDADFANLKTKFKEGTSAMKIQAKASFDDIKDRVGRTARELKTKAGEYKDAGIELIQEFYEGLKSKVSTKFGDIAQGIKDAINRALPDSITFFGGKGGIPAIRIPVPQFAQGGVAPGGLALVGERGPELAALPRGTRVFSNPESRAIASAAGETNVVINNNYMGPVIGSERKREIEWTLRYATRYGAVTA